MVIGAIPSSGLSANSPTLTKIVGLVVAALAALNYTAQRTALKRSYIAARLGAPAPAASKLPAVSAILAIVAIVLLVIFGVGCKANCQSPQNASSAECIVEGAIVDCTGVTSLASMVTVVEPVVAKLIDSAVQADGSINWSSIEGSIVNLALQYGSCVIAQIWNDLMNGSSSGSGNGSGSGSGSGSAIAVGSSSSAGSGSGSTAATSGTALLTRAVLKPADLAAEFNRIRAKVAPGRKFKINGQTL